MRVEQMDYSAFSERQASRSFDAALSSWHLGSTPGGVKETWTTSATKKGGLNFGAYSNPVFDNLVDSALSARSLGSEREYFRRAYQTIVNDAPAVWLYEPKLMAGVHKRLELPNRRADAWWAGLAEWSVPASQRIARDNLGLSARAP